MNKKLIFDVVFIKEDSVDNGNEKNEDVYIFRSFDISNSENKGLEKQCKKTKLLCYAKLEKGKKYTITLHENNLFLSNEKRFTHPIKIENEMEIFEKIGNAIFNTNKITNTKVQLTYLKGTRCS